MVAVLVQVKTNTVRTKHAIEVCDMVPGPRVRDTLKKLVDLLARFTPEDRLPEVARERRLLAPNAAPAGDSAE